MPPSRSQDHEARISVVQDVESLAELAGPWRDLAAEALESNVFYEPGMLLEALRHLRGLRAWQIVLVFRGSRLVGLFPLQRARLGGGTRLVLELLQHPHSFLHTPLVHRDHAGSAIDAWLGWCRHDSGAALVLCSRITVDGPVARLLRERLDSAGGDSIELRRYERPLLEPQGDPEAYLRRVLSSERRRQLRRRRALLGEQGALAVRVLGAGEEPAAWIDAFLALEASGWKGRKGTALACNEDHARFFRAMVGDLHGRGQALLSGIQQEGRWLAMSCHFRAACPDGGAFWFKPAFDEEHAKLSPGVLLETELIRLLRERFADVRWIDSCTSPDNELMGRLWSGRRAIATLALAVPALRGRLALRAMVLALQGRLVLRAGRRRLAGAVPARGTEPAST
ncbi:GNAT family N-acetyltransferase [Geminicoccaceae bacterium 1502E]|nr:GNAT family N-acetyltransferase [Geminicoccaceae bacterium 1502E]